MKTADVAIVPTCIFSGPNQPLLPTIPALPKIYEFLSPSPIQISFQDSISEHKQPRKYLPSVYQHSSYSMWTIALPLPKGDTTASMWLIIPTSIPPRAHAPAYEENHCVTKTKQLLHEQVWFPGHRQVGARCDSHIILPIPRSSSCK